MKDSFQHGLIEVSRAVTPSQVFDKVLNIHGDVKLLRVVVVLIHVQHYDCVGEAERSVSVRERLAIGCLKKSIEYNKCPLLSFKTTFFFLAFRLRRLNM